MSRGDRPVAAAQLQGGFTLVEGLVAVAILGAVIVLVQSTLVTGWGGLQRASGASTAVAIARARLVEAGAETPLREGGVSGETDGFRWQLEVSPYVSSGPGERAKAWWVVVTVGWRDHAVGGDRSVKLTTIKLAGPAR